MTQPDPNPPNEPVLGAEDKARLLKTLAAAEQAAQDAERALEIASASATRQSGDIDSLVDGAQRLAARGRDLRASVQQVRDMLERAKLNALNAGLEGARLGEPIGKVVVSMSDELRGLLARSIDEIDEHSNLLVEVERDRERWVAEVDPLFESTRALRDELARIQTLQRESSAAIAALGDELRRTIGGDPETLAMIAEASELTRNLSRVLGRIAEKSPDALASDALSRLLEPLLSLAAARNRAGP